MKQGNDGNTCYSIDNIYCTQIPISNKLKAKLNKKFIAWSIKRKAERFPRHYSIITQTKQSTNSA